MSEKIYFMRDKDINIVNQNVDNIINKEYNVIYNETRYKSYVGRPKK